MHTYIQNQENETFHYGTDLKCLGFVVSSRSNKWEKVAVYSIDKKEFGWKLRLETVFCGRPPTCNVSGCLQGATIQLNEETGAIQIARVMHGGAADRSGLINIGDEVHEVNGISVSGKEPDEIVQMLVSIYIFLILFNLVYINKELSKTQVAGTALGYPIKRPILFGDCYPTKIYKIHFLTESVEMCTQVITDIIMLNNSYAWTWLQLCSLSSFPPRFWRYEKMCC